MTHAAIRSRSIPAVVWAAVLVAVSTSASAATDVPTTALSRGWVFDARDGAALYVAACQGCHMADGRGAQGAGRYPALLGNPRLVAAPYVVRMVLHGNRAMPALGRMLDDAQVAAVATHVQRRWGGLDMPAITPADVAAQRQP
jgi:mono/diheme cytochrome c family protein